MGFAGRAVVVMAAMAAASVPRSAAAATTPIDPGDFTVTMDKPGAGADQTKPATLCTVAGQTMTLQAYVDNVVGSWNQQGTAPPQAQCTMTRTSLLTNASLTGTVVNKTVGAGTITQSCDMSQKVEIAFALTATISASSRTVTASAFTNSMTGFQACAWSMTFADARASRLTGTIEQTFGFAGAGAAVSCPDSYAGLAAQGTLYCLTVTSTSKVYVVGGAGAFSSTGGEGEFTTSDVAPVIIPRTGSVQGAGVRDRWTVPVAVPGVDSTTTANGLKLALLAGAKPSVRLVSPAKSGSGRTLGAGPDGTSQLKVKVAAVPGSKCGITVRSGAKVKTLLPPVKDADGVIASSITAAMVKARLGAKVGAKVTLGLSCTLGTAKATSTQAVTLGP